MKSKRNAAILVASIVLLCIMTSIDSSAAKPTAQLTIEPSSGSIGDKVLLSGINFAKNSKVTIEFFDCQTTTDKLGSFSTDVVVPKGLTAGTYDVTAVDESGRLDQAYFTVKPSIVLTPTLAPSKTQVTVAGSGFSDDPTHDGLTAAFDKKELKLEHLCNGEEKGTFTATFTVPDVSPGAYVVTVTSLKDSSINASATFNVTALVVTPENPFGALLAVFACTAAVFIFMKRCRK